VHQRLDQYRHESSLRTWIGRIAYSIAARHLERRRMLPNETDSHDGNLLLQETIDDGFDLEAAWADEDMKRTLHAAIDELPPLQRTLLTLYHLDEVPIGEIAQITGLATGTIKSHLFRARARLREMLEVSVGAPA
jgi:RNA polymerase sigma-70 factor (ECF subfamily)